MALKLGLYKHLGQRNETGIIFFTSHPENAQAAVYGNRIMLRGAETIQVAVVAIKANSRRKIFFVPSNSFLDSVK